MNNYHVVDVSHWQGDINPDKTIGASAKGIYIKAGGINKYYGSCYTDARFEENSRKFEGRIPVGYYFFFHPHYSGADQATYFLNMLSAGEWRLPPAVDVEANFQGVLRATYQRELKAFLDIIEWGVDVKPVIYTRATFWNANLGNPSWAGDYPLWIARYNDFLDHPWGDYNLWPPGKPLPWDDYFMWQWSADGNRRGHEFGAESYDIDLNRCNMPLDEFLKIGEEGTVEEPPPEPFRMFDVVAVQGWTQDSAGVTFEVRGEYESNN